MPYGEFPCKICLEKIKRSVNIKGFSTSVACQTGVIQMLNRKDIKSCKIKNEIMAFLIVSRIILLPPSSKSEQESRSTTQTIVIHGRTVKL